MLSLEREIVELRQNGDISAAEASRLLPLERRDLFSLHSEIRALLYAAVALITGGVGVYLRHNIERLSPATLLFLLAAAAAACYVSVLVRERRDREGGHTLFDDYLLVLGALLVSASVAYGEQQYHLLDERWKHHLLILAVFHALTAYFFDSRALLPIAIVSLAAWFGADRQGLHWLHPAQGAGGRILACAAVVLVWRLANRILRWKPHFGWVLEHFAINLALLGALLLVMDRHTEPAGLVLLAVLAVLVILWGMRKGENLFAIYGVIYLLVGIDQAVIRRVSNDMIVTVYLLASTVAAIIVLYWIRGRLVTR